MRRSSTGCCATTSSASTRSAGLMRSSAAANGSSRAQRPTATSVRRGRRTTKVLVAPVPVDTDRLAADARRSVNTVVGRVARRAARRTETAAPRRPHRPVEESAARVPRVRTAARAPPEARQRSLVPRAALSVTPDGRAIPDATTPSVSASFGGSTSGTRRRSMPTSDPSICCSRTTTTARSVRCVCTTCCSSIRSSTG